MLWKAQKKHLAHCLAQRQNSVNTQIYKVVMVLVIIFIFLSAHTQCTAGRLLGFHRLLSCCSVTANSGSHS